MRNLILFISIFSFLSISAAKENSFFVGVKASNGKFISRYKYEYSGLTSTDKTKRFYSGNYVLFGGKIKNISICTGLGYNLYVLKNSWFYPDDVFNTSNNNKINYHIISIPLYIDYNLNIYKKKLFVVFGAGIEYNLTFKTVVKRKDYPSLKTKFRDLNDYFNPNSLVISSRLGFLYNVTKRIDIYSSFDFGYMPLRYLPYRNKSIISYNKEFNYTISGSIGLNVKFGKNIKKEKKVSNTVKS